MSRFRPYWLWAMLTVGQIHHRKEFHMRRAIEVTCAVLVAAWCIATPTVASAEGPDPGWATCSEQTVSVTLSATDPTVYHIVGQLCLVDAAARGGQTVELAVSGLTYDHNYFNIPYFPETYSYVYAATDRGYSTFNIDRLGVGLSDRPPADQLTVQSHAYTVAQVVRMLRTGVIGGRAFSTVVGVGHSLGAGVLQYLAGTGTDPFGLPNYLILSGWLHVGHGPALATLGSSLYDARLDRAFASKKLPAGYLTTMPDTRGANFYHQVGAEPAMVIIDEALKQTGTLTERQTLAAVRASTVTLGIRIPVLLSVGQYDTLQCNEAAGLSCATSAAIIAREARGYGPRACLRALVVPGAGHSANMHAAAANSYAEVHDWLDQYTVGGTTAKDANGCLPV